MPEQNREKYGSTLTESNERPFIERQTVEYLRFIRVNNKNIYCSSVLEHGFMDYNGLIFNL